jgi:hypothetical protein
VRVLRWELRGNAVLDRWCCALGLLPEDLIGGRTTDSLPFVLPQITRIMREKYKPTYVFWYEEDFLSDRRVIRMPSLARHFYRALLQATLFCPTRPYLPADDMELMILADAEPSDWTIHRDIVMAMFDKVEFENEFGSGIEYSHPKMMEQWETLKDKSEKFFESCRQGGSSTSPAKVEAARRNGAKGGRPSKNPSEPKETEREHEHEHDVEHELDTPAKNAAAAAARRAGPSTSKSANPKSAKGAAPSVSPERQAIAREHFKKLVESGDKWALAQVGDDAAFTRPKFVDHVLESEPRGSGKSVPEGGYRPAQRCKCGGPKPCALHDLKLPDDDLDPDCYQCFKTEANKGKKCAWHTDFTVRVKSCPLCEKTGENKWRLCEGHGMEQDNHGG